MGTLEKICLMPSGVRVGGYLRRVAALSELGAVLRLGGREDASWTSDEEAEWDRQCDELDAWHDALTEDERAKLELVEVVLAEICRGEW